VLIGQQVEQQVDTASSQKNGVGSERSGYAEDLFSHQCYAL
jgi:hypothetical protein